MQGHIQLGLFTDTVLRDYALENVLGQQGATANPFAARVSTGGPYSELDTFNDWTISDWHTGVGNSDPESGPLFAIAETRFPSYLMPPPGWDYPATSHNQAQAGADGVFPYEFTLLSSKMYSVSFLAAQSASIDGVWVYVHCPYAKQTTVELRADSVGTPGSPGTVLKSASVSSIQPRVHAHWQKFTFSSSQALTSATRYHITIKTTVTAELDNGVSPYLPTVTMSGSERCYSSTDGGTTWALEVAGLTGFYYLFSYSSHNTDLTKKVFVYDGDVFAWVDNEVVSITTTYNAEVTGITIYDVYQIDNFLYIAYGSGYKRYEMDTDTTTDVALADSYMFLVHSGYLWRSTGVTLEYTADEVTWTPLPNLIRAQPPFITGMAGLGGSVYFATHDGLYQAAEGDLVIQVLRWPEVHADNGKGMVSWEGALYIPLAGGTIMRYDSSGSLINVGINAREELPNELQGTVSLLYPTNYFLMAVVDSPKLLGYSSLWAYNVDGWHCLSLSPQGVGGGGIAIDRDNDYLYWALDRALLLRTDFPSNVNNPARNLSDMKFAREGWVEYDRFYAGHRTLNKDIDRIYIDTERVGQNVHVYWQDDQHYADYYTLHTGDVGWQYLGVPTLGESTIQFPAGARPDDKSFRLALRLTIKDTQNTGAPVVRGISVKHSTNVADRWRWTLPILVSDNQQMPDGTINQYTAEEQKAHLDTLIAETPPLRFVDLDGTEYTVKVTGASRNVLRYDWVKGDDAPVIQWVYTVVIEEIT